ncbi:MAG: CheR family methyltransferase [Planctomycetota bacterium]
MKDEVFNRYRKLIYDKAGIALSEKKRALVRGRIGKRMRDLGLDSYEEYLERIEADTSGRELTELLDAISTNVTRFFREPEHFKFFADVVSRWNKAGQEKFRFWSAACSTGEEPYTMAMVLADIFPDPNLDWKILATDISTKVLNRALEGTYPEKAFSKVSRDRMKRCFTKNRGEDPPTYTVRPVLKRRVLYRRLNLADAPYPMSGPMDVIFARNVMIYFDNRMRKKVLEEMDRLLRRGGYLIVGHAESLTGTLGSLKSVQPSVYKKIG